MNRRYLVLGLSAFLALALAVPALGGPSNPVADISASAKKQAKKALKKAKTANQRAKGAQSTADQALTDAGSAQGSADSAQSAANAAQAAADAAQATADSKLGNTVQVSGATSGNNNSATKLASAGCPADAELTGGGYTIGGTDPEQAAAQFEFAYSDGWLVQAQKIADTGAATNWSLAAFAECATTG